MITQGMMLFIFVTFFAAVAFGWLTFYVFSSDDIDNGDRFLGCVCAGASITFIMLTFMCISDGMSHSPQPQSTRRMYIQKDSVAPDGSEYTIYYHYDK